MKQVSTAFDMAYITIWNTDAQEGAQDMHHRPWIRVTMPAVNNTCTFSPNKLDTAGCRTMLTVLPTNL